MPRPKQNISNPKTENRTGQGEPASALAPSAPDPANDGLSRLAVLGLCLASFVLSTPLFAPLSFWPFGYVVFVPWLIAICRSRSRVWAYLGSYLLGAAYFLFHFRWLYETTPEGYVAASLLYLAMAFPAGAWGIRHLYLRRNISLTITFPVVWTGIEMLRTYNPLGFPWFFLGHSQIRALPMVQIADLAGVYGVTFVLAAVNGLLADLILSRFMRGKVSAVLARPGVKVCAPVALALVIATFAYGQYRLAQSRFTDGPLTAVLQGDFLLRAVLNDPTGATEEKKEETYFGLMGRAVAEKPDLDLIVLPETPWAMWLNREFREHRPEFAYWHEEWTHAAKTLNKSILVGAMAEEPQPPRVYPKQHRYNSAFLYTPGVPEPQRYNKIHLVPFGEYVPFRYSRYLHFIYRFFAFGPWNPWGRDGYEYSLDPGTEYTVFRLPQSASGKNGRFGVTICYEDVIPRIFRNFVCDDSGQKRLDFMLNISNDGWFGHGTQQAQHLVNCAFRAIENRVGVARAANTGISGFVDPDGRWRDLVVGPEGGLTAGGTGYSVAHMKLDPRVTFYSRYGDVFGLVCVAITLLAAAESTADAWRRRRARKQSAAANKGK